MAKNKRFSLIYVFVSLLLSTPVYDHQYDNEVSLSLIESGKIIVKSDMLRISEFDYIMPVNNNYVIIHRQPHGVSVMDQSGELTKSLGTHGNGPYEWQMPRYIRYNDGKVMIWDSGNLKFLVYDDDFQPVEELIGIRHAINGFTISKNEAIAVFDQPRFEDEFIKIYQKDSNGRLSLKQSMGQLSGEGRTLFFLDRTGDIIWNGDDLIWIDPAVPELNIFQTQSKQHLTASFQDNLFFVDDWKEIEMQDREDFEMVREYVFQNSRILSLHRLADYILVEVEHQNDRESVLKYHLFDLNYNNLGVIDHGYSGAENYIRGTDGNRLFFWGENYYETGETGSILIREVSFN